MRCIATGITAMADNLRDVSIPIDDIVKNGFWLSLGLLFAPLLVFSILHGWGALFNSPLSTLTILVLILPVVLVAIIVHELLHAIGWMLFGRVSWRDIRFGFNRQYLAPYAHTNVMMTARAYRIGALLPGIVTGILPIIWGIIAVDGLLTQFGAFMLSAAVGDIIVIRVIRDIPGHTLVLDHPTQAGCLVKEV